jgi:hypothetical protein
LLFTAGCILVAVFPQVADHMMGWDSGEPQMMMMMMMSRDGAAART